MPIPAFLSSLWFSAQLEQISWIIWPSTLWAALHTFFHPKCLVLTLIGLVTIYGITKIKPNHKQARKWICDKVGNFLTPSLGQRFREVISHLLVHFLDTKNRLCLMLSFNIVASIGLNSLEVLEALDDWGTIVVLLALFGIPTAIFWFSGVNALWTMAQPHLQTMLWKPFDDLVRPHLPSYHPVMWLVPILVLMAIASTGNSLAYALVFMILVMVVTYAINAILFSLELREYQPAQVEPIQPNQPALSKAEQAKIAAARKSQETKSRITKQTLTAMLACIGWSLDHLQTNGIYDGTDPFRYVGLCLYFPFLSLAYGLITMYVGMEVLFPFLMAIFKVDEDLVSYIQFVGFVACVAWAMAAAEALTPFLVAQSDLATVSTLGPPIIFAYTISMAGYITFRADAIKMYRMTLLIAMDYKPVAYEWGSQTSFEKLVTSTILWTKIKAYLDSLRNPEAARLAEQQSASSPSLSSFLPASMQDSYAESWLGSVSLRSVRDSAKSLRALKQIQDKLLKGLQLDVTFSVQILNDPNHTGQRDLQWRKSNIEIKGGDEVFAVCQVDAFSARDEKYPEGTSTKIKCECLFFIDKLFRQRASASLQNLEIIIDSPVGPPVRLSIAENIRQVFRVARFANRSAPRPRPVIPQEQASSKTPKQRMNGFLDVLGARLEEGFKRVELSQPEANVAAVVSFVKAFIEKFDEVYRDLQGEDYAAFLNTFIESFLDDESFDENLKKYQSLMWSYEAVLVSAKVMSEVLTDEFKDMVYQEAEGEQSGASSFAVLIVGIGLLEFACNHIQSQIRADRLRPAPQAPPPALPAANEEKRPAANEGPAHDEKAD